MACPNIPSMTLKFRATRVSVILEIEYWHTNWTNAVPRDSIRYHLCNLHNDLPTITAEFQASMVSLAPCSHRTSYQLKPECFKWCGSVLPKTLMVRLTDWSSRSPGNVSQWDSRKLLLYVLPAETPFRVSPMSIAYAVINQLTNCSMYAQNEVNQFVYSAEGWTHSLQWQWFFYNNKKQFRPYQSCTNLHPVIAEIPTM